MQPTDIARDLGVLLKSELAMKQLVQKSRQRKLLPHSPTETAETYVSRFDETACLSLYTQSAGLL